MATAYPIIEKTKSGLLPASAYDADLVSKHPVGAQFDMKPRKSRSLPQNRLYWEMLTRVVDDTVLGDTYPTAAKLHDALLRDLGFVTLTRDLNGKPYVTRDSTAFDAMNADEFRTYMDRAVVRLNEITETDVLAFAEAGRAA